MKIHDITRLVHEDMAVYKNLPIKHMKREILADYERSDYYETNMTFNSHTGTHIDAPLHMVEGGETIEQLSPELYIGKARLIDLTDVEEKIHKKDLERFPIEKGDILLIRTRNWKSQEAEVYNPSFVYLEEDGAEYLREKGIKTLGIDAMSVERGKAGHPTHKILLGNGIGIIEDLFLKDIPEGEYFFTALPLKIKGAEASMTRAVLIEGLL